MKVKQPETSIKVLIDTDLILELFIHRSGFVEQAEALFDTLKSENIQAYITDQCLNKLYMYPSTPDPQVGIDTVCFIKSIFEQNIISITYAHLVDARSLPVQDFDSSVEVACGVEKGCDAIITQYAENFNGSTLAIWSTEELKLRLELEQFLRLEKQSSRIDEVIPKIQILSRDNMG
jgi:hypothetical protein